MSNINLEVYQRNNLLDLMGYPALYLLSLPHFRFKIVLLNHLGEFGCAVVEPGWAQNIRFKIYFCEYRAHPDKRAATKKHFAHSLSRCSVPTLMDHCSSFGQRTTIA